MDVNFSRMQDSCKNSWWERGDIGLSGVWLLVHIFVVLKASFNDLVKISPWYCFVLLMGCGCPCSDYAGKLRAMLVNRCCRSCMAGDIALWLLTRLSKALAWPFMSQYFISRYWRKRSSTSFHSWFIAAISWISSNILALSAKLWILSSCWRTASLTSFKLSLIDSNSGGNLSFWIQVPQSNGRICPQVPFYSHIVIIDP